NYGSANARGGIAHGKVPSINPRHPLNAERESEFPRTCALRRTLSLRRHHALAFPSERCAEISGTIPPGAAFPNLDRCHAYAERMPAACRRMFEAGERNHASLREAGIARTCDRVSRNCRRVGTPQPSFHGCETTPRVPCECLAGLAS